MTIIILLSHVHRSAHLFLHRRFKSSPYSAHRFLHRRFKSSPYNAHRFLHRRFKSSPEVVGAGLVPARIIPKIIAATPNFRIGEFLRAGTRPAPTAAPFAAPPFLTFVRTCMKQVPTVAPFAAPPFLTFVRTCIKQVPTVAPFATLPLPIFPRSCTVCRTAVLG